MRPKEVIHEAFKRRRSINQTKQHNHELIVTIMSSECRFRNDELMNSDLMIARAAIQLQVILSSVEFIQKLINN